MKEQVEVGGKVFKYKGWRIPDDYKLPAIFRDGQWVLDAELRFESEDGVVIGIHPKSDLLKGGENE